MPAAAQTTTQLATPEASQIAFMPVGDYEVKTTVKSTGRVLFGNIIKINGSVENNWAGSTYLVFASANDPCSRSVVVVQNIKDSELSLMMTRPTMKDCNTTQWVIKKTDNGFAAESYLVVDGVRAGESTSTSVFTLKK